MLIDENVHALTNSYTTKIIKGTTARPRTVITGTITGTSYSVDYSHTGGSCHNGYSSVSNISPCNTTLSYYNGRNYLTFPDDHSLKFTVDATISVIIQSIATGDSSNPANWHPIIGKGVLYSNNKTVGNYKLFQMGDRIYFE
ncbi:MAG: hypothetical protein WCF90_08535 [Methanomicrobiales archaeon]